MSVHVWAVFSESFDRLRAIARLGNNLHVAITIDDGADPFRGATGGRRRSIS